MTINTTALREIAEAATPGPWGKTYDPDGWILAVDDGRWVALASIEDRADAVHIAAFHPGTALALLDEVEALRAQVERVREALFASEAEVERLHSWEGLMSLLDEHWPESMIPTLSDDVSRDPGPRIVSLLRWVEALRRALDGEVEA